MKKTVVLNIVGLTRGLIGPHTPFIKAFLEKGSCSLISPALPAVTCTAQATYLTGLRAEDHGIVGNGWFFKEEQEVKFWRQSNRLIRASKLWDSIKQTNKEFTCANMFWWYNMYSTADYTVTPRPNYLADGRKIPDVYSTPADLRDELQEKLGQFPLFHFWGPMTSIRSSQWIAEASKEVALQYDPDLTLVYLPHLDYNLQRHGPDVGKVGRDLEEIDKVVEDLVAFYRKRGDYHIVMLSEYGITAVDRPVHLNREFRSRGWLSIRQERGLELLDAGASEVFAVADHQVAHVYVKEEQKLPEVISLLEKTPGVGTVLYGDSRAAAGLDHERSGDIVVVADERSWFTYYYWLDDAKAPDFARTVDIHRKPGYDPVEMFTDPDDHWVAVKTGWKLLKKKLGFRTLMDLIPLKPELVKGSHGRIPEDKDHWPLIITNSNALEGNTELPATAVYTFLKETITNTQYYESRST